MIEQSLSFGRVPDVREDLLQADRLDCSLRRFFVDEFYTHYVALIKPESRVLDLGGQKSPKRGQFNIERYDLRVRYANLSTAKRPDVQTDAAALPFAHDSFDAVICAELIEHVPDPPAVLNEVYRVLRPQGMVLISVPFLYQIHADPYDYGRYTDYYWQENLKRVGFVDVAIEKQGLFWSVLADMIRGWACERAREGRPRSAWLQRVVAKVIAKVKRMALAAERGASGSDYRYLSRFTTGFGIRAVKP